MTNAKTLYEIIALIEAGHTGTAVARLRAMLAEAASVKHVTPEAGHFYSVSKSIAQNDGSWVRFFWEVLDVIGPNALVRVHGTDCEVVEFFPICDRHWFPADAAWKIKDAALSTPATEPQPAPSDKIVADETIYHEGFPDGWYMVHRSDTTLLCRKPDAGYAFPFPAAIAAAPKLMQGEAWRSTAQELAWGVVGQRKAELAYDEKTFCDHCGYGPRRDADDKVLPNSFATKTWTCDHCAHVNKRCTPAPSDKIAEAALPRHIIVRDSQAYDDHIAVRNLNADDHDMGLCIIPRKHLPGLIAALRAVVGKGE